MGRTMVQHVRFKTVYISLSSSAKHLREITNLRGLQTETATANYFNFHFVLKVVKYIRYAERERERAYHKCLGRGGRQTVVTEGGV